MRYIVGGYSSTRTDAATPWFHKDLPRKSQAVLSPSVSVKEKHRSDNCTSIYIIYIHPNPGFYGPFISIYIHLWILNDTEWGSTPRLLGEEDRSIVPVLHLEPPQRSSGSESRYLPKTLSYTINFKALQHVWNKYQPDEKPGEHLQFQELHLVNHLLKFGALRRLGVCAFISKK